MRPQIFLNLHFWFARAFHEWREKAMIIAHRMKLFILMPWGSGLPSPDTTASKGYVTIFFWQQCSRDEQPYHPYHKNSSTNWEIKEEEEERKAKACALQDLFFAPKLDLDLEKKEASESLYCIRRRNHILARSRFREEGSKWLALLYEKKEPYSYI
jgi:hypothetical protein